MKDRAIVMGASSGGMKVLEIIFSTLPVNFSLPIVVVQHVSPHSDSRWITHLNNSSKLTLKEADEKEKIESGYVYFAPPNYHLIIEKDKTFSLSIDERVNFARPAIDVLFESAAEVYKTGQIGVILTGSNSDGTAGLKKIKEYGGLTIAQDTTTAESAFMPASAIAAVEMDYILTL